MSALFRGSANLRWIAVKDFPASLPCFRNPSLHNHNTCRAPGYAGRQSVQSCAPAWCARLVPLLSSHTMSINCSHTRTSCPVGPSCRDASISGAAPPAALVRSARHRRCRRLSRNLCTAAAVLTPPVLPFQRGAEHLQQWTPDSWRSREAKQQPNYPDAAAVSDTVEELSRMPPLIFAGECRNLQARLAACSAGEAFWLQGSVPSVPACSLWLMRFKFLFLSNKQLLELAQGEFVDFAEVRPHVVGLHRQWHALLHLSLVGFCFNRVCI